MDAAAKQHRLLVLQLGENHNEKVYRLNKDWRLVFACSPTINMKNIRLFTNYPVSGAVNSDVFRELRWMTSTASADGYETVSEDVSLHVAGTFRFYFTIDKSDSLGNANGQGYFIVDPQLIYGKDNKHLPLDAIQLHTVMPKLLGPFTEWVDRLKVSHYSNYNMIHFTPLQKLNAESNSSYSISDQLEINPAFSTADTTCDWDSIAHLVSFLNEDWSILSMTDMVYNHTANDSVWLLDHPECAYNLSNSPHLKPAYLLDRLIHYTSSKVSSSHLSHSNGIPSTLNSESHLDSLRKYLHQEILALRLEEFYSVDIKKLSQAFSLALEESLPTLRQYNLHIKPDNLQLDHSIIINQDPSYNRLSSDVNIKLALKYFTKEIMHLIRESYGDSSLISEVTRKFQEKITSLNQEKIEKIQLHMRAAVEHVLNGVRYRFLDENGPKLGQVTPSEPLVHTYFINKLESESAIDMNDEEALLDDCSKHQFVMVHNGWVMNDDPMRDFAKEGSNVYLRRELVVWGDSVKLRYGDGAADCPYLWHRMEEYTKKTVSIFHGIRLDNCHSTPIHVAEHMMRLARSVRPDLYVVAELFTSHENLDNIFVNRLGLNSLIREGLTAWDAHEQGRLVYRYGGRPVGSFFQPSSQILTPSVAHALFMDATHDNDSIITKRTVEDSVSLSAYIAMSSCATGSNRGYDELIPYHINVVTEKRLYQSLCGSKGSTSAAGLCSSDSGMMSVKAELNSLHHCLGVEKFDQVYVHDLSTEVVSLTRHNPLSHKTVICAVRSAFTTNSPSNPQCDDLTFEGVLDQVLLYARLDRTDNSEFVSDDQFLTGVTSHQAVLLHSVPISQVPGVKFETTDDGRNLIKFHDFPPGSVLVISVNPVPHLMKSRDAIYHNVKLIHDYLSSKAPNTEEERKLDGMLAKLSLSDLNLIEFCCESEELSGTSFGAYNIPNYGALVYTGLKGVSSLLSDISRVNDLGHALCQNLREGDWLLDYSISRLKQHPSLTEFSVFVEELFAPVRCLPRYLIPSYIDLILTSLSSLLDEAALSKMSRFIRGGASIVKDLALCSLQFCARAKSSPLAPLSPQLLSEYGEQHNLVSISAGLPHFSEGLMRIWGRDTFISLRGLLLTTGRFAEARAIILSFAGTLRHGLIPNLLGGGTHARYNCRDAVWWWLQAIQDYCNMVPQGVKILKDPVTRLYPTDDSEALESGKLIHPLSTVMQEALQRHSTGIRFRERNAGSSIDEHMSDEGFNVEAGVDWTTGFVYGGNQHNCGTWMDKMGSSVKAGNKGKPATPRNGSAVELVALCASTVQWLSRLHSKSLYPHSGVVGKRPSWECEQEISFSVWYELIRRNFESYFWVDVTYSSMESEPRPDLINKKNIYKDSIRAAPEWANYQLRPNFTVAIVVAPDLFLPENALAALNTVEKYLVGPLGLKTLDPEDWAYNGDYNNGDDSDNYNTAAGFNYHQGPEWLWPCGYYMRARLIIAQRLESSAPGILDVTLQKISNKLALHHLTVCTSKWRSLPELTNADAQECKDGCPAQAWSVSCLLDVLYDMHQLKSGSPN